MKRNILNTKDGSSTIYVPELNEHYHSTNGAIQESMHVFIYTGLEQIKKDHIKIFELGFGTGLNCLLTWLNSKGKTIEYTCIEKYPVENEMVSQLNYSDALNLDILESDLFLSMHNLPWDESTEIAEKFFLTKIQADIKNYIHNSEYDLVYFDAFAPNVQPDLWNFEIFNALYNSLANGSILTTYCAKGVVRRTMQKCGFKVERLPGPPGKREILRATK